VRAWRLYLAGSLAAFRCGTMQLFQILFAGSQCQPVFWTRAPLYAQQASVIEATEWTASTS
jgi:cyclopropane-fatty-acyl-phospholipid synthase